VILVIAVSYFGFEDLEPYLQSLKVQTFEPWRLVVVDNSEDDAEWDRIERWTSGDRRVLALKAPKNLGYFGAVDWALKRVDHREVNWLIVSNTDVRLAGKDAFAELARVPMDDIGVLAPSIRSAWTGRDQNPYQVHRPTVAQMRRRRLILGNPILAQLVILMFAVRGRIARTRRASGKVMLSQSIYAAHGSFFAVSRTFLDRGGSFDFPMFLFAEELFLAEQAKDLKLQTLYAPTVRVEHMEHRQTGYLRSLEMLRCGARAAHYGYDLINADEAGRRRLMRGDYDPRL